MRKVHASEQLSLGREFDIKPRHRLLFGIRPDIGATDRLTRLMVRLRNDKIMPGKPVDADRLHITLHHLGDFVDQMPPSLVPMASLAAETVRMQPFNVTFDRVGGTRGPFLLRASDWPAALMEFRQTLSAALVKAGLRSRVDPVFKPHVTLSYDFSDVLEQPVDPISWTVSQFILIESLLDKHQHIERGGWPIRR
ncbi:MAG TPA: 2'-5' RNA ligase family protein [Gemmataceae bacterium]|jgi:2'-5' RNA ligase|nr:2'-5' RNA ligase family protein [Gemmataceae bacterium]